MREFVQHYKGSVQVSLKVLLRWTLLAVCTGVPCGAIGAAFHLAVEAVTEWRTEQAWLLWLLPVAGLAITALYKGTGCTGKGTNDVLQAVQDNNATLVGLSALMTTTVPSMEETIVQLRKAAPWARVMVGGAVLTQEYADTMGADQYCRDAMASVNYAEQVFGLTK